MNEKVLPGYSVPDMMFSRSATMERPKVVQTTSAFAKVEATKFDNGGGTLKGLRIFKAGTFKDSMGYESTWEVTHLEQMAFHFNLLRDNGYFPNVPLRVDHSYSAESVVGYLTAVYRDTEDDNFLACDVEITEPDAYEKWERGTFRSRSLEVGMYETNEGAAYYPVVMGLAFVDIPAVEGLYGRKETAHGFSQVITDTQEDQVPETKDHAGRNSNQGEPTSSQSDANLKDAPPAGSAPVGSPPTGERSGENGGYSDHSAAGAPRQAPSTFRVDGRETSDHAAVQRHIEVLETFRTEAITAGRAAFVTSLSENGQIMATQVDSMTALVQTMTEAQYNAFKDTYKDVPSSGLFEKHGTQRVQGGAPSNPVADEIEVLEETVKSLHRSGMKPEAVEKTNSYKRLQALKAKANA